MVYALISLAAWTILANFALLMVIWWINQRVTSGIERADTRAETFTALKTRLEAVEARPQLGAEGLQAVHHEIEQLAHKLRDNSLRVEEAQESVSRLSAKWAARAQREKRQEREEAAPSAPEEHAQVPMFPAPQQNGQRVRRFGSL